METQLLCFHLQSEGDAGDLSAAGASRQLVLSSLERRGSPRSAEAQVGQPPCGGLEKVIGNATGRTLFDNSDAIERLSQLALNLALAAAQQRGSRLARCPSQGR